MENMRALASHNRTIVSGDFTRWTTALEGDSAYPAQIILLVLFLLFLSGVAVWMCVPFPMGDGVPAGNGHFHRVYLILWRWW